jgi:multiple sugar transport system substrate-binding protein
MAAHRHGLDLRGFSTSRRRMMAMTAGLFGAAMVRRDVWAAYFQDATEKTGIDVSQWNPEAIRALAGTREFDTAADLHALFPESTSGSIQYWNVGPTEASPQITKDLYDEFLQAFAGYFPNITLDNQNVGYNDLLDKIRTAAAGGAAPDVAKLPILWGVEFAARGQTR